MKICLDSTLTFCKTIPFVFDEFELNENWLFETREKIDKYLRKREEYVKTHPQYTLETGDFTVFKLYEMSC